MAVAEESARLRRCVAPIVDCICKMRVEGLADNQLVLEQVIAELQKIEQSVERKTLSNLKIRMALRSCLKELRKLSLTAPPCRANWQQSVLPATRDPTIG
jgi:hypothetical protein